MDHRLKTRLLGSAGVNIENVRSLTINIAGSTRVPNLARTGVSKRQRFVRVLNLVGKIVSAVAGVAVATFATMAVLGYRQVAGLQVDSLLAVVSITFIGGIVSIGGINLLTLQTNLRRQQRLLQSLQRQDDFEVRFLGSFELARAWHHYSFPSRGLILVYGHEHEARLYKAGDEYSCLWRYGEDADLPVHFAQSAARHGDRFFALGDYSSGAVTIFDLETTEHFSIHVFGSQIEHLEFSPGGHHLLVTSYVGNSAENGAVVDLRDRSIARLSGGAPAAWLNDGEVLFVTNEKNLGKYDINTEATAELWKSHGQIVRVTASPQTLAFGEESNKQTELFLLDSDGFVPINVGHVGAPLEQLQAVGDLLVVASSWNGQPSEAKRLRLMDRDGQILSEVRYDSGFGHGYPKYSVGTIGGETWFCTTGANRIVRLFRPGHPFVKVDLRRHDSKVNAEERVVSVQLTTLNERSIELSVLSEHGRIVLFSLDQPKMVQLRAVT